MPKSQKKPRRKPREHRHDAVQARSKATVARILDAAMALTVEKGAEAVTMSDIAKRADVVIGALYRYFADKNAINKAILLRHYDDVDQMLKTFMWPAMDADAFVAAMQEVYARYFDLHQSDPVYRSIWSIVQTDAELQKLDVEDTLKNTRYVVAVARPLFPDADPDKLMAGCAMLLHLAAPSSRFALMVPAPMRENLRAFFQQVLADAFHAMRETRDN